MHIKNSKDFYGLVSISLHWLMALMIITLLFVGFNMEDAPIAIRADLYMGHKATGVLVLILALCRLSWRFVSPPPGLPGETPYWQKFLSKITIMFLYTVMLIMPISGISMNIFGGRAVNVFGLFTIPATSSKIPEIVELADTTHAIVAYILVILITLHFCGAMYHWLVNKDGVLQRMLVPGRKT